MTAFTCLIAVLVITIFFWIKSESYFNKNIEKLNKKLEKKRKTITKLKNAVDGQVSYRNRIKEERNKCLITIRILSEQLDKQNEFMQSAVDKAFDRGFEKMEEKNARKKIQNNKNN